MDSQLRSQVVFHLTGRVPDDAGAEQPLPAGLRPALLAQYRHLESIRHDFPVVFARGPGEYVVSLAAAVDGALRAAAPQGAQGEAMRKRALHTERLIRDAVAKGAGGTLLQAWDAAVASAGTDDAWRREMKIVRDALAVDGELAECDSRLPARFLRHAWAVVQREKVRAARSRIDALVLRLEAILRADYARSAVALQSANLQQTFGGTHQALFDFAKMSQLLSPAARQGGLDSSRRARIEWALRVLREQAFFPPPGDAGAQEASNDRFTFDNVPAALESYRNRLPDMLSLLKALHLAELEAEGQFVEQLHGPLFERMQSQDFTAADLQFFPDYLVTLGSDAPGVQADLGNALSSGMPVKVLLEVQDLLEEAAPGQGRFSFGMRGGQLAFMAMTFGDAFVLQSAASNLLQLRDRLQRGLRHAGPALFSVYAPADGESTLPGYLAAASAMQSRAFPAFSYDPGRGSNGATRFSLENNPQPEADWPLESLTYADQDLQAVTEELAFTFVDFLLADRRHSQHFAAVPRAHWGAGLVSARQWLESPPADPSTGLPFILAVDDADLLCRVVVDERMMRAAQRCREAWHRLQELGGIHDSRAEALLARERALWEQQQRAAEAAILVPALAPAAPGDQPSIPAPVAGAAVVEDESAPNPDVAYIETLRCSSCNECTLASPKMFAYDQNKQAYITDLKAGSYRQLVEAAESCQVSVIHPGKPWNPDEPGLDELIERARPFL
ncbi:MAG: ferredoxin, partial [Gammaproteobacteria bacterium]|nr:ferredoxin [Gammaproteobacteria bacterium]